MAHERTHFFCHDCKVVVEISIDAAEEVAKHQGHLCEYTTVIPADDRAHMQCQPTP